MKLIFVEATQLPISCLETKGLKYMYMQCYRLLCTGVKLRLLQEGKNEDESV